MQSLLVFFFFLGQKENRQLLLNNDLYLNANLML